jgi:hypothetical protein
MTRSARHYTTRARIASVAADEPTAVNRENLRPW